MVCSGALNPPTIDPTARPHPLIRGTASRFRSHSRKNENGILLPREPGGLGVKVSEGMLDRELQVMAKVASVLEQHGFSVEVSEQGRTLALINGEHLSFGIEEPIRRVVTQKPRVLNPTDRWDYDEVVTHEPSGKLALIIHSGTWERHEQRTKWSDAKLQRIENLIPDFVSGLMRIAVALRCREEDRKRREAEQQKRALAQLRITSEVPRAFVLTGWRALHPQR